MFLKIVSAYIFHFLYNLSCFLCDLCACTGAYVFEKCKRLQFSHFVHHWKNWTNGQNWANGQNLDIDWTNLDKIGHGLDISGQMDKVWTNGQKSVNPLIRLGFRLFCPHFCPFSVQLDMLMDKKRENP